MSKPLDFDAMIARVRAQDEGAKARYARVYEGIAIERGPWIGFYNYYPLLNGEYLLDVRGRRRVFGSPQSALTAARRAKEGLPE